MVPNGTGYCLVGTRGSMIWSRTNTEGEAMKGSCAGYIMVPANVTLRTSAFWVMKYEAKNIGGVAASQPGSLPWVSISQIGAMEAAKSSCATSHLIAESEWMSLAADVLRVPSSWSGGAVGSGYIYSGHNDNAPAAALGGSTNDADGYVGTGQSGTSSQRRTFTLTNGEIVWDIAGNVLE